MDHFQLKGGVLHAEDVALPVIAAAVGTPAYVYSRATLARHARVFREALAALPDATFAYAVKANPNLAVLKVMAAAGYGADVVSGGELARAEMVKALDAGIGQFNIESEAEGDLS